MRLLNDPKDIYIAMRAEPRENYSDTYTASKEETTNEIGRASCRERV